MPNLSSTALPIAILTGPTASGKTETALRFAREAASQGLKLEIINGDSICVFRGFEIGAAKPALADRNDPPHHLIDIRDPDEPYTAGDFVRDVERTLQDIESRHARALIVGGTGFYLKALMTGFWGADRGPALMPNAEMRNRLEAHTNAELYQMLKAKDEASAYRITAGDRYRLVRALEVIESTGKTPSELSQTPLPANPRFKLLVIDRNREELLKRIDVRTRTMIADGFLEEVQALRQKHPHAKGLEAVGYREACEYLAGKKPEGRKLSSGQEGLIEEMILGTRQLVKKQRTWFRSQPAAEHFLIPENESQLSSRLKEIYNLKHA